MRCVNKVILVGYVGKDPEIRVLRDGRKIANFSVATNEQWRDKATGERKENTSWHNIVVFNSDLVSKVVEKYIKKGSSIYIEGMMKTRKYTDKGGSDRWTTEVVLQNYRGEIVLLESSGGGGFAPPAGGDDDYGQTSTRGATATGGYTPPTEDPFGDGIPF
jgi:single-strand DNA-binding protein